MFPKNRERLLGQDVARLLLNEIRRIIDESGVASGEHFSLDGTQLEAWAGRKSFRVKDEQGSEKTDDDPGNPAVDLKGEKRRNDTHQSKTGPDSRLYRKAKEMEARLSYPGHVLIDNRNGLVMQAEVRRASDIAEQEAGPAMVEKKRRWQTAQAKRFTLGADRGYDDCVFVGPCATGMPLRILRCGKTGNRPRMGEDRWDAAETSPPRGPAGELDLRVDDVCVYNLVRLKNLGVTAASG